MSVSSLKDEVKHEIRTAIISNKLKPGERIVETEIAKKFSISQVPVREALRGLEEEGLVRTVKYKGAFVTEIDPSEIYHIFLLRSEIESNVIEMILPKLTKQQLAELDEIVEKMQINENTEDDASLSALDLEFHSKIIQWGKIETYNRIWNMLYGHILRFNAYMQPNIQYKKAEMYGDHKRLVHILATGDVEKAKAAFQTHIMLYFSINKIHS
ncbi:GntR family transcriptional regulator [Ammoniphilus sp. 3BR4]|uniref:GntR family transcriptional regulator n=1 Tax=Ammoniphilus sp. 3BR4 TaxID=3158265 RepID=UPI003465762A